MVDFKQEILPLSAVGHLAVDLCQIWPIFPEIEFAFVPVDPHDGFLNVPVGGCSLTVEGDPGR